jgi:hypothetical protein
MVATSLERSGTHWLFWQIWPLGQHTAPHTRSAGQHAPPTQLSPALQHAEPQTLLDGQHAPLMQLSPALQHAEPQTCAAGHVGVDASHGAMQYPCDWSSQQPLSGVSQK